MKQIIFLLLLVNGTITDYAQREEFDMYYPENNLYRVLKVKSKSDIIAHATDHHYKMEFDTLGRQTSWYYIEEDSIKTMYYYSKNGDTLIRNECLNKNGKDVDAHQFEKFLYDNDGKIEVYEICRLSYEHSDERSYCELDKFFYDEKGTLTSKLIYLNSKYPQPFSKSLQINPGLLVLSDVYAYGFDKSNHLALKKEMSGKPDYRHTDSFFYDAQNRLIKTIDYAPRGFLGELYAYDITYVTLTSYETDKKTVVSFTTSSGYPTDNLKTTDKVAYEYIYYPNGLEKTWAMTVGNGDKSILEYNTYEFY